MRGQYVPLAGGIAVFLTGIALLFEALYPISGDAFSFFRPFYIYLGSWLLLLSAWAVYLRSLKPNLLIFVAVIVAVGCLLPVATWAKFSHNRRLYDASRYGHLVTLRLELSLYGKTRPDLDDALVNAALGGQSGIVEYLLKNGANPNARLFDNNTALMLAVHSKSTDCVRLLLHWEADVNAKNKDGMTALMWAARTNAAEVARVLLNANADKSARNNDGESALSLAQQMNFDQLTQLLNN